MQRTYRMMGLSFLAMTLLGAGCTNSPSVKEEDIALGIFEEPVELDPLLTPQTSDLHTVSNNCPGVTRHPVGRPGGYGINVWVLKDGKCYPSKQFTVLSSPDACYQGHYHFDIMSLDGDIRKNSQPCGSAVETDVVESSKLITVGIEDYKRMKELFKDWQQGR